MNLAQLRDRVTRLSVSAINQAQQIAVIQNLLDLATAHIPRTTIVDIAGLTANSTTTKTATWTVPVSGDYRVVIQPFIASARLGTIFATVVASTKGPTSVDIAVVNSAGTALAAGVLDVVIHPA